MTPKRIRLQRTKGWRKPPDAVLVARPSRWGNPYPVAQYGEIAADLFETELRECIERPHDGPHDYRIQHIADHIDELRGRDLACWCPLDAPCHADALLEIANA